MGVEPTTSRATVWRSATELYPPQVRITFYTIACCGSVLTRSILGARIGFPRGIRLTQGSTSRTGQIDGKAPSFLVTGVLTLLPGSINPYHPTSRLQVHEDRRRFRSLRRSKRMLVPFRRRLRQTGRFADRIFGLRTWGSGRVATPSQWLQNDGGSRGKHIQKSAWRNPVSIRILLLVDIIKPGTKIRRIWTLKPTTEARRKEVQKTRSKPENSRGYRAIGRDSNGDEILHESRRN